MADWLCRNDLRDDVHIRPSLEPIYSLSLCAMPAAHLLGDDPKTAFHMITRFSDASGASVLYFLVLLRGARAA